jgi:hypothetical protein
MLPTGRRHVQPHGILRNPHNCWRRSLAFLILPSTTDRYLLFARSPVLSAARVSTNPAGPNWVAVTNLAALVGYQNVITNSTASSNLFFRLTK